MNIDFAKYADGLVPAIVQDGATGDVLMLGFMNAAAIEQTETSGRVTFFSRSKQRLWTKGETSGNFLEVVSITPDCDNDTLLIKAHPSGPVCHTGAATCFGDRSASFSALDNLEAVIANRRTEPVEGSYVSNLFSKGLNKIAQKVGEEAVETVIAAKDDDIDAFKGEAADLLFHYLILLQEKGLRLGDITEVLKMRRR
jgi:phosphoribosyl-AMP cyclohydrolase / phosphoribosyl-ATP pyrophosphohydrolase